jgi:predicted nucleotidyltransferase
MILRTKDKALLTALFETVPIPIEVWVYGSRVNGKAHEGSDLDLVVRTPTLERLPFDLFFNLKEQIRDCNVPIIVEVFDWARLPQSFHARIEANYEVFFRSYGFPDMDTQARGVKTK